MERARQMAIAGEESAQGSTAGNGTVDDSASTMMVVVRRAMTVAAWLCISAAFARATADSATSEGSDSSAAAANGRPTAARSWSAGRALVGDGGGAAMRFDATSVSVQEMESSASISESSNMKTAIAAAKSSIQTRALTPCSGAALTDRFLIE